MNLKQSNLNSSIENLLNKIEDIKTNINYKISQLPDNKKIKRLNNNCFTINFKDLSDDLILSPFYYDFKSQYKTIIKIIEKVDIIWIIPTIEKIITPNSKGHFWYIYKGTGYRFNPEVIKNIKSLL